MCFRIKLVRDLNHRRHAEYYNKKACYQSINSSHIFSFIRRTFTRFASDIRSFLINSEHRYRQAMCVTHGHVTKKLYRSTSNFRGSLPLLPSVFYCAVFRQFGCVLPWTLLHSLFFSFPLFKKTRLINTNFIERVCSKFNTVKKAIVLLKSCYVFSVLYQMSIFSQVWVQILSSI